MPSKRSIIQSQKMKQNVIPVDEIEVGGNNSMSLTVIIININIYISDDYKFSSKRKSRTRSGSNQKIIKKWDQKKEPVVEDDEPINDEDQ